MTFVLSKNAYFNDTHFSWVFTDEDNCLLLATNNHERAIYTAYEIINYGHQLVDEKGDKVKDV